MVCIKEGNGFVDLWLQGCTVMVCIKEGNGDRAYVVKTLPSACWWRACAEETSSRVGPSLVAMLNLLDGQEA
jgi:hypothetical protein